MKTRTFKATVAHSAFHDDLTLLLKKHGSDLTALELLAISAQVVGKCIALQDQRTVTSAMAMRIVSENIEAGNRQVIDQLMNNTGGNA